MHSDTEHTAPTATPADALDMQLDGLEQMVAPSGFFENFGKGVTLFFDNLGKGLRGEL